MERADGIIKGALSAMQPQSQENMQDWELERELEIKREQEREAAKEAQRSRNRNAIALGGLRALETFTLARFRPSQGNQEALQAATAFDPKKDNLYVYGPAGTGKTHLAAIASRRFTDRIFYSSELECSSAVVTVSQASITREIRERQSSHGEQVVIDYYSSIPILVLDDLGAYKETEFSISVLYEIINGRYMNQPGGLIVTSNLSLDQLSERFGEDRICSRLAGMCKTLSLEGEPDHRINGRQD